MQSGMGGSVACSVVFGVAALLFKSKPLRQWLRPKFIAVHRVLTVLCYPCPFVWQALIYWPATKENAFVFKCLVFSVWLPCSIAFYAASWKGLIAASWTGAIIKHMLWFYIVDLPMFIIVSAAWALEHMLGRTSTNRLFGATPSFKGKNIVILGNGPSLVKGKALGKVIDSMDEVVRFNNFQTRSSGLEEWTGTKTTVHFSDSMLYPSYPEYHVPGATVALSLFMDRLLVGGSYLLFRTCVDLCFNEAYEMLRNPALGWISEEDISSLKEILGISHWKHPTSGCLAIDWFVRHRPDPSVPVYIHGFDFFEGPEIHYYSKTEPLYERINDLLGVKTMHQPGKEKAFVAKLVLEGKVKWLHTKNGEAGEHTNKTCESMRNGAQRIEKVEHRNGTDM